MQKSKNSRLLSAICFTAIIVAFSTSYCFAEVTIDAEAINSQITAAVASGVAPKDAAKAALKKAIGDIIVANPSYEGGQEALRNDILALFPSLHIEGLDTADLLAMAGEILGMDVGLEEGSLEAYETPGDVDGTRGDNAVAAQYVGEKAIGQSDAVSVTTSNVSASSTCAPAGYALR